MTDTNKITPIDDFRRTLKQMEPQFKSVLPPHIDPEKFTRVVLTAVQSNPDILTSDKRILFVELLKCANDGLVCDGREAAITVYKTKHGPQAKYMPMVYGLLKRIRNSDELKTINSAVVYEKDKFDYFVDETGEHIVHRPEFLTERGKVLLTYAIAATKDGGIFVEIITEEQMEKIRAVSRAKESGPWFSFPDEMRRKTAIRRLSKRLPMNSEVEKLVKNEDDLYELKNDQPKIEETKKVSRLEKLIQEFEALETAEIELETVTKQEEIKENELRAK